MAQHAAKARLLPTSTLVASEVAAAPAHATPVLPPDILSLLTMRNSGSHQKLSFRQHLLAPRLRATRLQNTSPVSKLRKPTGQGLVCTGWRLVWKEPMKGHLREQISLLFPVSVCVFHFVAAHVLVCHITANHAASEMYTFILGVD
jgi:hypothetical protein